MRRDRKLPDETIIWQGCPSQVTKLGTYLICGLVIGLALVGTLILLQIPMIRENNLGTAVLIALSLLLIATLSIAFWNWLLVKSDSYIITTERILITTGIWSRQTEEVELYRVRDVSFIQPLFLRPFGLSHLVLRTTDTSSPTLTLAAIPNARSLWDGIRRYAEVARANRGISEIDFT